MDELDVAAHAINVCVLIQINSWVLKQVVRRPYLSETSTLSYSDVRNDIEVLIMRCTVYTSLLTLLVQVVNEFPPLNMTLRKVFINTICAILIVMVVLPQAKIFQSFFTEIQRLVAMTDEGVRRLRKSFLKTASDMEKNAVVNGTASEEEVARRK
ncbi:hypothetical protein TrST_g110 [Triparma strigata]|uniref:Uncharacterized protein n=1 Tax=Triparma strigata TaxID=1606541 RepID=A0A9W7E1H6_9STRA|nr:hypothetical protein TrST_g110 [Triparma strigata]